ncbi:MAG: SpoIIIAH-like family protein [Clostridiales bacterium]|nr:SpoIIIAH-like family protein [Clostridiales bacterium]
MKNMIKKNQVMITALAIMIAVAGYLNFAGTKVTDEEILTVNGGIATDDLGNMSLTDDEIDYSTLFDLSEEDIEQSSSDILSLDSDVEVSSSGVLDESVAEGIDNGEVPGEAVFTASSGLTTLYGAKLQKEQTRAQIKETLLGLINNENISEDQKQAAVDSMIVMTDIAEKETAAEILLEAKGFTDSIVSIDGESVDVVINMPELTEAQRAQIEDIVTRKTGLSAEAVVISTVNSTSN